MTIGSLRDQVIYPDTVDEMKSKGFSDALLEDILERVYLRYVITREGGSLITVVNALINCLEIFFEDSDIFPVVTLFLINYLLAHRF